MSKLSLILALLLYILIFFLRYQQGGWDIRQACCFAIKWDVLRSQRQALDQKIATLLPSPQAELLSGILLGQNTDLPGHLKLALRDTSTLHIVVASGQNLNMTAGFFLALSGLIKRKNALLLSLVAAVGYTILSGMQIPVIRALIMFSLASLAQVFGRQRDGIWVLSVTAGLMLLINPSWITSLSFQLSFLATLGVIWAAPVLLKYLKDWPLIGQDLAVAIGAQLMVMPIIAQNFHQLSLVGVLVNLLIGWTISFIMILGSVMLFLNLLWTPLAQLASIAVSALLTYFIYIVEAFATLPFAWEYVGEQVWIVWAGYYMIVGGVVLGMSKLKNQN